MRRIPWSASHVFISLNNRKDAVLGATYMTKEGYEKLKKELDYLLRVRRKEIAASLAHAREFGDLSENAEYEVAKQEQQMNEQKIGTISAKLSNIMIIDNVDLPKDIAYIGAKVAIRVKRSSICWSRMRKPIIWKIKYLSHHRWARGCWGIK